MVLVVAGAHLPEPFPDLRNRHMTAAHQLQFNLMEFRDQSLLGRLKPDDEGLAVVFIPSAPQPADRHGARKAIRDDIVDFDSKPSVKAELSEGRESYRVRLCGRVGLERGASLPKYEKDALKFRRIDNNGSDAGLGPDHRTPIVTSLLGRPI